MNLRHGSPVPLKLLGVVQAADSKMCVQLEQETHHKFHHLRCYSEWFLPGPELLTFIEQR
jgi:hypothetical protein